MYKSIIDKLNETADIPRADLIALLNFIQIKDNDEALRASEYLREAAQKKARGIFGSKIYIRGLIEFSSYCRKNCLYCGIRRDNGAARRYRLSENVILSCCEIGYDLGFRTFVLQSGEDPYYTDDRICDLTSAIKKRWSDCAVTLSIGEKSEDSYRRYREAGADRYLLRHETADGAHYQYLHVPHDNKNSYDDGARRKQCLFTLKKLGFQTGAGFMVGSPGQTTEHIATDIEFLKELQPHMIGIGPFIPHRDTPFAKEPAGSAELTIRLISILRLTFPYALIPATTALGTALPDGRERGVLAGANVVMPNLSPIEVRKKYELYDNKICTGDEAAECRFCMQRRIENIGYEIAVDRGDYRAPAANPPKTQAGGLAAIRA